MKFGIFKNKKILVTGHTGFKGSWLVCWLYILGAKVTGISLTPEDKMYHLKYLKKKIKVKDLRQDIRDEKKNKKNYI